MSEAETSAAATNTTESQGAAESTETTTASTQAGGTALTQQGSNGTQTTETQANQGAEGGEQAEGETGEAKGAPEKYEFKQQEGAEIAPVVLESFESVAKELNLSQDSAQKILDTVAPIMAQQQAEAFKAQNEQWIEATKADKEFGGAKLDQNLAIAKKALDAFGTPELRSLLDRSGLGNNPEVIRAFYRAGMAISEDRIFTGAGGGVPGNADARSLYANSNMNP